MRYGFIFLAGAMSPFDALLFFSEGKTGGVVILILIIAMLCIAAVDHICSLPEGRVKK